MASDLFGDFFGQGRMHTHTHRRAKICRLTSLEATVVALKEVVLQLQADLRLSD